MNNRRARKSSAASEKCGCFPPLRQVTIGDSDEEVEKVERKAKRGLNGVKLSLDASLY
jgi:hypothetical protein